MHQFQRRLPLAGIICLLSLAAHRHATAQGATPPYHGFRPYHGYYDTVFMLGAHLLFDPDLAIDSLHITYTQHYQGRPDLRYFFDTARWGGANEQERWELRRNKTFYEAAYRRGYKVIYEPHDISHFSWTTRNMLCYAGEQHPPYAGAPVADSIQQFLFDVVHGGERDSIFDRHVWGVAVPPLAAPRDTAIVLGSRGTRMGLFVPGEGARYWGRLRTPAGIPYADSSEYWDLGLMVRMDNIPITMDSTTVLAYTLLYKRETVGQPGPEGCRCAIYTRFDSLAITKGRYLDDALTRPELAKDRPYREARFTFRFPERWRDTLSDTLRIPLPGGGTHLVGAADSVLEGYTPVLDNYVGSQGWFGWPAGDPASCRTYCERLLDSLKARGVLGAASILKDGVVEEGDFHYDLHTTRRVPVTFLRGRVGPHTTSLLLRGDLDSLIHNVVDSVYAPTDAQFPVKNPTDSLLMRFGITGESQLPGYFTERIISGKVQHRMLANRSGELRGVWNNPIKNHGNYRVSMGDLDSTDIRMIHMMATQSYHFNGPLPVFYALPDSMSERANNSYYRLNSQDTVAVGDTLRSRLVAGTSASDYAWYTARCQTSLGLNREQLADAIDVARRRYNHIRNAPYPVWDVVQVMGWLGSTNAGLSGVFDNDWRPTSPQEITAQAWLAINSGVDGIHYSDFSFCGLELGVMHYYTMDRNAVYDTLNTFHPVFTNNPNWTVPKMWLGFRQRFDAVKRMNDELYGNVLPVYRKVDRNGVHMALHRDTSFTEMPLLAWAGAEKASQYDTGAFQPTGTYDSREQTYMDVTAYVPGPYLEGDEAPGTRFLVFSNLRCWPIDFKTYSDTTKNLFNGLSVDTAHRFVQTGLGNIDVRRPVVILKRWGEMADRFRIQRLGDTAVRTVAADDTVALDWLEPGWGAMYRVTPIRADVSRYGVAWNNAVRSENPSSGERQRSRVIVYERDSAVYLRAFDSVGVVSREWLISDAADTAVITSGGTARRTAYNRFPAVAVARNGAAAGDAPDSALTCLVVWERRGTSAQASLEALHITGLPSARGGLPAVRARRQLLAPRSFVGGNTWMALHPAVVGVDSGWVVAAAAPGSKGGVDVIAMRDRPGDTAAAIESFDTAHVVAWMPKGDILAAWPADSICGFPTLAYTRNVSELRVAGGTFSDSAVGANSGAIENYQVARLAYQQGKRANSEWDIMYNTIGVRFPLDEDDNWDEPVQLWLSRAEWASQGVPGCNHVHPSIANDATAVVLAFETEGIARSVTMRFRDPVSTTAVKQPRMWRSALYRWGDGAMLQRGPLARFYRYTAPSVTLFPSLPVTELGGYHEGALAWQWTNAAATRRNRVLFYHFGTTGVDTTLPDGADPTLTLTSNMNTTREAAYAGETMMRRGSDAERRTAVRPAGDSAFYYPGYVINTASTPHRAFRASLASINTIVGHYTIGDWGKLRGPCDARIGGGIQAGIVSTPLVTSVDTLPPPPVWPPAAPPTTFMTSTLVTVDSIAAVPLVARTGPFRKGTGPAGVRRIVFGGDSLVAWLDTQPYDTANARPANIFFALQIVRASDDSVLWVGDTMSARGVAADSLDDTVSVPVHTAVPGDTVVYIRHVAVATPWLDAFVSGGFAFSDDVPDPDTSLAKRTVRPQTPRMMPEGIAVAVAPNPVGSDVGELEITATAPGTARITIHDMAGDLVLRVPPHDVQRAGVYVLPLDFTALRNGVYIVDVRIGAQRGTARFTVVR